MATTIEDTASRIGDIIKRLTLPFDKVSLFSPLHLKVAGGAVESRAQAQGALLVARPVFRGVSGEGEVSFVPDDMLKFLALYGANEEVNVEIGEVITIRGARRSATVHVDAATPKLPSRLPVLKDGAVWWKGGEVPSAIVVEGEAKEFAEVLSDAKVAEVRSYPFTFADNATFVTLGGDETKRNRIERQLDVSAKGERVEMTLGLGYAHVFSNVRSGRARMSVGAGLGAAVQVEDELGSYLYIVAEKAQDKGE